MGRGEAETVLDVFWGFAKGGDRKKRMSLFDVKKNGSVILLVIE